MTTPLAFDVHTVLYDDQLVLSVVGELDLATAPRLRATVDQAWEAAPSTLVLDLAAVTFCDWIGVNTLEHIHKECQERDIRLALAGVPLAIQWVLRITGLSAYFDRYRSVGEALDADAWQLEPA